jgi:hypothetical protein
MRRLLLKAISVLSVCAGASGLWSLSLPLSACAQSSTNVPTVATETNEVWKVMEDYFAALAKNQIPKANELAPTILARGTNDADALSFFSWRIFADRNIKHRDRSLALAAATRASQLTGEKDPSVLDVYARALWENGRRTEAITHQRRAVELCTEEAKRINMEANLNRYVRLAKQR